MSKRLAVALAYGAPNTPRVVAIGHGQLGERIIETARAHGVPLEENPPLAQALSTIELDEEIPQALYVAVAQISQLSGPAGARGYQCAVVTGLGNSRGVTGLVADRLVEPESGSRCPASAKGPAQQLALCLDRFMNSSSV